MSLLSLPTELHYRIFDYLDLQTILSNRCVCKHFYAFVTNYNRFKLDFDAIENSKFAKIVRSISPTKIISVVCFGSHAGTNHSYYKLGTSVQASRCSSIVNVSQFTQLRSVTLFGFSNTEINGILQHLTTCALVSLNISFYDKLTDTSETIALLSSIIAQSSLRSLHLNEFAYMIQHIPLTVQFAVSYLEMRTCTYTEYNTILYRCPNLKTFVIGVYIMNADHNQNSLPFHYPQLTSLTIKNCQLLTRDLKLVLSLTPSLICLKLKSSRSTFDLVFDGVFWQALTSSTIPLLRQFEFFFSYQFSMDSTADSLDYIVNRFRTPFWMNDRNLFVTCDFILSSLTIKLYTIPVRMFDGERLSDMHGICTLSSMNSTSCLIERWETSAPDRYREEVCQQLHLLRKR